MKTTLPMPDILISEPIPGQALDDLATRYAVAREPELWRDRERLLQQVAGARALIVRNMTRVDRELLSAAPRLQAIGRIGVGMDNIDTVAAAERGVAVCYPPEENAISVAEHVFALLLGLARHVPAGDRMVREGRWDRLSLIGFELYGKTLGVLGFGRIGMRVGIRARAFGMTVLAYDPYLSEFSPAVTESAARLLSLDEVLSRADAVSCHLPLTPATRCLLGRERLARMKRGAILINTSRGPVVDEQALYDLLRDGHLGGAALDVREQEPPGESPLHTLPNVVFAPHIAGWTHEAHTRVVGTVVADVERVLRGETPRYRWRGEAW
jgi:D-3-phosphoglycerate dehydrogenase